MEEWMTVRTRQPVKTGQLVGLSFGSKTIPFVSRFSSISISPIRSVKFDNIQIIISSAVGPWLFVPSSSPNPTPPLI